MDFLNITFLDYYYLILILIIPIFIYFFFRKNKKANEFSFFKDLKKVYKTSSFLYYFKITLIVLILIFYILLLANPNKKLSDETITKNGIDIVIALDLSASMNATDLKPDRLESAKWVIEKFINNQTTNRLWLIVFSWKPFTSIPLTFDYWVLKQTIDNLSTKTIDQSKSYLWWTAIWDAILMSNNLFEEEDREKVVILLTDGDANVWVDPKIAALKSKEKDIKVYTIGIWSKEGGGFIYNDWYFNREVTVPALKEEDLIYISNQTNAKFYRATDNDSLEDIFDELEKLEKNDIEIESKNTFNTYYKHFVYTLILLNFLFMITLFYRKNID